MAPSPHVLISGAGLGGLCLAQALKKADISFHVYERDFNPDSRPQGYRIRIHGEGVNALRYALGDDKYDLFKKTCARIIHGLGLAPQADPITGEQLEPRMPGGFGKDGRAVAFSFDKQDTQGRLPVNPFVDPRTVDRRVLRDVLSYDIGEHISHGKEIIRYETDGISSVTAFFKDGTQATGTLLVGAEGVHSAVRKQYLPDHGPLDTGSKVLYGKTPFTEDFQKAFSKPMQERMSGIIDHNAKVPTSSLLEPIIFPAKDLRRPEIDLPDDYVYWIMATQADKLPYTEEQLRCITNADSAELANKLSAHWHDSLKPLFSMQSANETSMIHIRAQDSKMAPWEPTATVTLIGDAIHAMPPTGASGAVTALRDAGTLAREVVENGINKESIGRYEAEMRKYAGEIIDMSVNIGIKAFGFSDPKTWVPAKV